MDIDDALAGRGADVEGRFARSHLSSEHLGVSCDRPEHGDGVPLPDWWTDH